MGNILAQEQQEVAVHPKGVGGMEELGPIHRARAIFPIKINQRLGAVQLGIIPARHPKRGVQSRVERVMDGQKVADVVSGLGIETVVVPDERGRRLALAVDQ